MPLTRRGLLISTAGLVAQAGLPRLAHACDAEVPAPGGYLPEQEGRILDVYFQNLPQAPDEVWKQLTVDAATLGKSLNAPAAAVTRYLDIADELRHEEGGGCVTLLPRSIEGVPAGLSKLSRAATVAARYALPFLVGGPAGTAFKVIDLVFKSAAWFAQADFQRLPRQAATQRLVPLAPDQESEWRSPVTGRVVAGRHHTTALGEIFVGHETVRDEHNSNKLAYVVGTRRSGDIADEGSVRMWLLHGLV